MKRQLNKSGIYLLLGIFIIIIIIIMICIFNFKEKKSVKTIIEYEKSYNINITYPILNNGLDKKLKNMINEYKNNFILYSKENKSDFPYELIINYSNKAYENINFLKFKVFQYTGGAHSERYDISYYYTKDKILSINQLFNDNYLDKLSKQAYYKVMKYGEENSKNFDDNWVKEGTKAISDNYKHMELTDKGLKILFVPYQISSWSDGEIEITIPYKDIKDIIKSKYYEESFTEEKQEPLSKEIRNLEPYKNKKLLALTFDDGPGYQTTEYLLDELKKRDAKVTFFTLGSRANQFPNIVKREYEEGHLVGSHTYNHKNLFNLTDYEIYNEINQTNIAIKNITGSDVLYVRPPYGNTNNSIKEIGNMYTILWNVDTLDWKLKNRNKISTAITSTATDGGIILLHDLYFESIEGVLLAIDELKKDGYEFVTIEEMIKLKNINLDKTKNYYNFK